jgi:hypothetical protein
MCFPHRGNDLVQLSIFKLKRDPRGENVGFLRAKAEMSRFLDRRRARSARLLLIASSGEVLRLLLLGPFVTILAAPAIAQEEVNLSAAAIQPFAPAAQLPSSNVPPGRVGRLSLVSGKVGVRTSAEWLDAELNFPVAADASVRTGPKARAEIEIGADTFELTPESEIEIVKLEDRAIQVSVVRGRIGVALRWLDDGDSVELDVSGECVPLLKSGRYDIDAGNGRVMGSTEDTRSDFDETRFAAPYYISSYMTGFAELDAAGSWQSTAQYSAVWVPSELPADWAPYHDGHWRWIAPWGWTWIDHRPWGFVTSHYGRWAFVGEHWVWVPGTFGAHPVYVPAVVTFLGTAGVGLSVADISGPAIGWFPLAPGEVYWPSYTRNLNYIRRLNFASIADVSAIQLDVNGDPPLEVFGEHFANRRFAGVVPRPVFRNGGAVAPALLSLPEQRLQNAPVLMGSPQIGPPEQRVAAAPAAIKQLTPRSAWTNRIAALVARGINRAKALQTAFAQLRAREPAARLTVLTCGRPPTHSPRHATRSCSA